MSSDLAYLESKTWTTFFFIFITGKNFLYRNLATSSDQSLSNFKPLTAFSNDAPKIISNPHRFLAETFFTFISTSKKGTLIFFTYSYYETEPTTRVCWFFPDSVRCRDYRSNVWLSKRRDPHWASRASAPTQPNNWHKYEQRLVRRTTVRKICKELDRILECDGKIEKLLGRGQTNWVGRYEMMKIPKTEAIKFTRVSWLPSLAETSAKLLQSAWCWVIAARVAPPATPTIAFIVVEAQSTYTEYTEKYGMVNSSDIAISFRMSANKRQRLHRASSSLLQKWKDIVLIREMNSYSILSWF